MTRQKISFNGNTFYQVNFSETESIKMGLVDVNTGKPIQSFALTYDGVWWKCFERGMKPANSTPFKTPKAAARNSWNIEINK